MRSPEVFRRQRSGSDSQSSKSDAVASDGGSIAEMLGYHCDAANDGAGPYDYDCHVTVKARRIHVHDDGPDLIRLPLIIERNVQ